MSCPEWGGSLIFMAWFEEEAAVGARVGRRLALPEWGRREGSQLSMAT